MNKEQQNTLTAYRVVDNVCIKYKSVWEQDGPFTESYGLFAIMLPRIEQCKDIQMDSPVSLTAEKKVIRETIVQEGTFIAMRIKRYALKVQDTGLAKSMDYSEWDLRKATDNELVSICNLIISKATPILEELKIYSVSDELFASFKKATADFSAMIAKPLSAESQTKNATATLAKLFKETDSILANGLDLDIEVYKKSNPDFYNELQAARKANKAASSVTALRASVKDKVTGKPVKAATLVFAKHLNGNALLATSANGSKITKKTTDKGNLRITNMVEGIYDVTISKTGYKDQTITVTVLSRETLDLVVEMEKG